MNSFSSNFSQRRMKMHCPVCRVDRSAFCCDSCVTAGITGPRGEFQDVRIGLVDVVQKLSDCLLPRQEAGNSRTRILLEELRDLRQRVSFLNSELQLRESTLMARKQKVLEDREKLETRRKRMMPRQELSISFETYMKDATRYEKSLSSLHPFRKLRSIAQTLFEERRLLCMKLLSIFRFRLINMHEDNSSPHSESPSSSPPFGTSELVGDFYTMDGQKDQLGVVILFIVPLIIMLSRLLDVPLPFPMIYGLLCSSPVLHAPKYSFSFGCSPFPRVLNAHTRQLIPMEKIVSNEALNLLSENLRYLSSISNQIPLSSVPFMEPMASLSSIFTSPNLGRAIYKGPVSFPSSPSISASSSPILSSSYRKSAAVIEQSLTEGGEWTLLDQL